MTATDLSPATAARLRTLRLRMTALIALLATVAVTIFAVVVIRLDRQLRDEQVDTELLRIGDTATRQLSFEEGNVQPESPSIPDAVVAVTPSFSIEEFQEQQEIHDFPDPEPGEIEEYLSLAFDESEFEDEGGGGDARGLRDGRPSGVSRTRLAARIWGRDGRGARGNAARQRWA